MARKCWEIRIAAPFAVFTLALMVIMTSSSHTVVHASPASAEPTIPPELQVVLDFLSSEGFGALLDIHAKYQPAIRFQDGLHADTGRYGETSGGQQDPISLRW